MATETGEKIAYIKSLTPKQRDRMLLVALNRLIECEEVGFFVQEDDGEPHFYWSHTGDDLKDE